MRRLFGFLRDLWKLAENLDVQKNPQFTHSVATADFLPEPLFGPFYLKVRVCYNFFPFRPNFFLRLKKGILDAAASARPLLSF